MTTVAAADQATDGITAAETVIGTGAHHPLHLAGDNQHRLQVGEIAHLRGVAVAFV
jgi:hypothetical protein